MNNNIYPAHEENEKSNSDFMMIEFAKQFKKSILNENGYEYFPNQMQQLKFSALVKFIKDKAETSGNAEVLPIEIIPREMCGYLEADFAWFSLNGEEEVEKFNKLLSYCSAFSACQTADGKTRLSFTVPYLFNRKKI